MTQTPPPETQSVSTQSSQKDQGASSEISLSPEKVRKPRRVFGWFAGCSSLLLLFGSIAINIGLGIILVATIGFSGHGYAERLDTVIIEEGSGETEETLMYLPIHGVILHEETGASSAFTSVGTSAEYVQQALTQAAEDETIKGILLDVNSPGGSVSASDTIAHAIEEYKKDTGNPVVAFFGETAASGGYYIATSADAIIASPTTLTGSIGVIFQTINVAELLENYGIRHVTFRSGDKKDILNYAREITEEERQIMQTIVEEDFELFKKKVLEHRELSRSAQEILFDGRIVSAGQAQEYGLVDQIGYTEEAWERLAEEAGVQQGYVVLTYQWPFDLTTLVSGGIGLMSPQERALEEIAKVLSDRPEPMYLWTP